MLAAARRRTLQRGRLGTKRRRGLAGGTVRGSAARSHADLTRIARLGPTDHAARVGIRSARRVRGAAVARCTSAAAGATAAAPSSTRSPAAVGSAGQYVDSARRAGATARGLRCSTALFDTLVGGETLHRGAVAAARAARAVGVTRATPTRDGGEQKRETGNSQYSLTIPRKTQRDNSPSNITPAC